MSTLLPDEIEELGTVYLVANTPRYLYKRLRAHPLVTRIGNDFSIDQLLSLYTETAKKKKRSIGEVSLAYAALVALGYKDWEVIAPRLETLNPSGLDWASDILEILKQTDWRTKIISLDMANNQKVSFENVSDLSTSKTVQVKSEPLIRVVRG